MFLKKKKFFSTMAFLLAGFLAFNLCQIHPTSEDSHASTHQEEQECNNGEIISSARASSFVECPAQLPGLSKSLDFKSLTSESGNTFLKQVSLSPFRLLSAPNQTTNRYQIFCAYLI